MFGAPPWGCGEPVEGTVIGATVLISAAAGAAMIGAPTGPPSPAPGVPDLVAIVHEVTRVTGTAAVPVAGPALQVGEWRPSWPAEKHAEAVALARAAIARGDLYQVNIVGHAEAEYRGPVTGALAAVAGLPGASWAGQIAGDGWAVASGSPECLISVERGPFGTEVRTLPIKGTGPRTDAGLIDLRASDKERAEHVMIVDMSRNDLGRIATTGSVRVEELFGVRPWCDLWQAESTVSAQLRPGTGLADLLRAVCPGASVTGAPKLSAIRTFSDLEPVGRGPSMGALGFVGHDRIELGLTIRTVAAVGRIADDGDECAEDASGVLHRWAGGGITWSSDPWAEVAEAAAKAAPLEAVLTTRMPEPV